MGGNTQQGMEQKHTHTQNNRQILGKSFCAIDSTNRFNKKCEENSAITNELKMIKTNTLVNRLYYFIKTFSNAWYRNRTANKNI